MAISAWCKWWQLYTRYSCFYWFNFLTFVHRVCFLFLSGFHSCISIKCEDKIPQWNRSRNQSFTLKKKTHSNQTLASTIYIEASPIYRTLSGKKHNFLTKQQFWDIEAGNRRNNMLDFLRQLLLLSCTHRKHKY